jgi:Na+/serine symporter
VRSLWRRIRSYYDHHTTTCAGLGLVAGLLLGTLFPFTRLFESGLELIVDVYGSFAPFMIYFILAPSLLRIAQENGARFPLFTALWYARLRILACLLAILLVSVAYGLPLTLDGGGAGISSALAASLGTLGTMLTHSPYFFAIYASIATTLLLWRRQGRFIQAFSNLPNLVEKLGEALTHVVPLFTLLVGVYVANLPLALQAHFASYPTSTFGQVTMLGLRIDATSASGILGIYVAASLLTGLVSTFWHLGLLVYVKLKVRSFSLKKYLSQYFVKIYPLLWATSSEALATPLNMHLLKKLYPQVDPDVRRFAVGIGSVININGTLTCCFVMIPAVCMMLGLDISLFGLLLCFPVIYVIGFGVPGIPGELVLFAGPIMGVLGVPEALQSAFLLTFLGLQIGLPDSFRTGANSTDDGPASLLLNEAYQQRFRLSVPVPVPVPVPVTMVNPPETPENFRS